MNAEIREPLQVFLAEHPNIVAVDVLTSCLLYTSRGIAKMYDNGYGTDPYGYQPQPQPRPSRASSFLRTVLSVLVLVVLVVLLSWGLRTFVFQAYEIPSGSMAVSYTHRPCGVRSITASIACA